jgi:hypothetical protein
MNECGTLVLLERELYRVLWWVDLEFENWEEIAASYARVRFRAFLGF